jgi:hypothetical protein
MAANDSLNLFIYLFSLLNSGDTKVAVIDPSLAATFSDATIWSK